MSYIKWFDPPSFDPARPEPPETGAGDYRRDDLYRCDEATTLAVNVAMATERPLLVSGPSGCGKTALARYVKWVMQWQLYPYTVTSRTTARDLLYSFDQLKRLQDVQVSNLDKTGKRYLTAGVLWKAFDPVGANQTAASTSSPDFTEETFRTPQKGNGAVVLLDEIDKADPDVPNNLLEPLGSYRFEVRVDEMDIPVVAQRVPLVILTTNNERRLPDAFLRRCVDLELAWPERDQLVEIGRMHFSKLTTVTEDLLKHVLAMLCPAEQTPKQNSVSIAEYLDTVRACAALSIEEQGWAWSELPKITVRKPGRFEQDFK